MDNGQVIKRLLLLHRLCLAGERGFEVVAANVGQRGLKLLLKTYAQQRAQFADELQDEIRRLGQQVSGTDSLLGIIHRGRINILAALTIGAQNVEKVVLGEALVGEKAALRLYESTLTKPLPPETRTLLEEQYEQVKEARARIELLRGKSGSREVVGLFDSERDAEAARRALELAGLAPESIETVDAGQFTRMHVTKGSRVRETVIAGAVGGAIGGGLVGGLAGISNLMIPELQLPLTLGPQGMWAALMLGGMLLGALGVACLGFLIGVGIADEDAYHHGDGLKQGVKLMSLHTDMARADKAAQIMLQQNVIP